MRPNDSVAPLIAATAICAVIAVAAYLSALSGTFVWDDTVLADGSGIGGGSSLAACFRTAFLDHFYRPLVSVSFYLDRLLWPENARAYHWVNIILHAAGTVFVVLLAAQLLRDTGKAAIAGVLFATHPVHLGATAWIGGRTDTLGTLWTAIFALGLVAAAHRTGNGRSSWLALSVVAYTLALFTKEQTLFLLPLIPLTFAVLKPDRGVALPADGWFATAPFLVAAVFYLSVGAFLGMPGPAAMGATTLEQAENFLLACGAYAELLFLPTQRSLFAYSLEPWRAGAPWSWLWGGGVVVAVLGSFLISWSRNKTVAWAIAFCVLSILPVSNFLPMPFLLFAHYRAAVAGIGFACLLAEMLGGLRWSALRPAQAPAAAGAAVLTAWYVVHVLLAIPAYRNEETLFRNIISYDSTSVVARYMLARLCMNSGRPDEAALHLEKTLDYLYGTTLWRHREAAVRMIDSQREVQVRVRQNQGLRQDPRLFLVTLFKHLGYARMHAGQIVQAREAFRTALKWESDQAECLHGLAWCDARLGNFEEARQTLLKVLAKEATPQRYQLMAQVLEHLGQPLEARTYWRLSLQPVSNTPHQ